MNAFVRTEYIISDIYLVFKSSLVKLENSLKIGIWLLRKVFK